jgi:spermidine synthase
MSETMNTRHDNPLVFPAVGACFLLSGFAALLYQTAWMRQLSTVFGTSELAVATVLAAYMAGLALGAAIAARVIDRIRRPVLVYGVLEAAIAGSALAVPFLLGFIGVIYAGLFGGQPEPPDASGMGQSLFYLAGTFLLLVTPTACMGATLPMLTRYAVRSDDEVGPRVGALYALNTFGAIGGTLLAAFLLLPSFGLMGTIIFGAAINLLVFAVAAALARTQEPKEVTASDTKVVSTFGWRPASWILPIMLIAGATTFTYEVLWTRLLSHVLGGSVVAFATMLASFLSGIALGSAIAARIAKTIAAAQVGFVVTQIAVAATSVAIFVVLDRFVPEVAGLGANFGLAIALLLPATIFIGATYPFAVRILSRDERDAAVSSARVYSWNTVGAIAGAVFAGFVLIPALRYEGAIQVVVTANLALGLFAAVVIPPRRTLLAGACAALLVLSAVGFRPAPPEDLLRVSPINDSRSGEIRFYDVGRSATVLLLERGGYFYLRTNGLSEASIDLKGAPPTRLSHRLLTTFPILARPNASNLLIVGFGGGVVAEAIPPTITDIDIVELEPKVIEANQAIGAERSVDPLADPRVSVIINDARNALRLTGKTYDVIVSQPSHPWTAGASHLYTREFMQLVRSRLADNGAFLQWMNMQLVSEDLLRSLVATLLDVFPYARAYHVEPDVMFFLASGQPISPEASLARSGEPLASDPEFFARLGIGSVNDLIAALAWDQKGLESLAAGAELITDDDNLMATQSALELSRDTFDYTALKSLIREYGPLFDTGSDIHQLDEDEIDFVYVADRLSGMFASDLAVALTQTLEQRGHADSFINVAKALQNRGQPQRADQMLLRALADNPGDAAASYLLLRSRRSDVVAGTLPERIREYAANLTPSAAAVINALDASARGDTDAAREADAALATALPSDQWHLDAAKLRADWRIKAVTAGEDRALAEEAMAIVDSAIALHADPDIYGMRLAAAFLARDFDALIETARRTVQIVRSDIDMRLKLLPASAHRTVLIKHDRRVRSVREGVAIVREGGTVPGYKIGNLDAEIDSLLQKIDRALNNSASSP